MNTHQGVARDERTVAVENTAYRWAYAVVTFGLLIDVAYRGWARHEAAWDLLALPIAGGAIAIIYQAWRKAIPRGWLIPGILLACGAAVIAGIAAALAMGAMGR